MRIASRCTARLQHRHIVVAYDANRVRSVFYLAMELVKGPNLERLVREQGPIEPALAYDLMRQAAGALRYAHEQGVIHCDVKPANLLVAHAPGWNGLERDRPDSAGSAPMGQPPPCLKILDFGIARVRGLTSGDVHARHGQAETGIFGTPDFVAPEQAQELSQADARSDLYSLGCTFYFALTGRVPFAGETTMEKLIQHLTEVPRPIEELCPGVTPALAAIIRRLMAKAPKDRFQSAAELGDALAAGHPPLFKLPISVAEAI